MLILVLLAVLVVITGSVLLAVPVLDTISPVGNAVMGVGVAGMVAG